MKPKETTALKKKARPRRRRRTFEVIEHPPAPSKYTQAQIKQIMGDFIRSRGKVSNQKQTEMLFE